MREYAKVVGELVSPVLGISKDKVEKIYMQLSGRPFREQLELMGVPKTEIDKLAKMFEEKKKEILRRHKPSELVWERINKLRNHGIKTALSTNNECTLVKEIEWINRLFDIILCHDPKRNISKGFSHLKQLYDSGFKNDEIIFVGDSDYDLEVYAPYNIASLRTIGLWKDEDKVIETILRLNSRCNT